jgi:ATP-dependent DNA ligase
MAGALPVRYADVPMVFIPPMLYSSLRDPALLANTSYIAEPKLDGQRIQVHVAGRRAVACYSWPGRELLRHVGLAWLRCVRWPVAAAILDGELFSGEGSEGIDAILQARGRAGSADAIACFDVLEVDGQAVMAEPWTDRRKRLEDLVAGGRTLEPRIQLVPVTDDPRRMWTEWVVNRGG